MISRNYECQQGGFGQRGSIETRYLMIGRELLKYWYEEKKKPWLGTRYVERDAGSD